LLKAYEASIRSLALVPSDGGRFEVIANEQLIFSKHRLGRHAEPGEVVRLLGDLT
jgi:selenoprotein W-related protein